MKKIYAITFGFLLSVQFLTAQTTQTFNYTGSQQTFTVPACVTSISIQAKGAMGANSNDRLPSNTTGGLGGIASGNLSVSPGDVLYIYVGGQGNANGNGGFNGGASGGYGNAGSSCIGGPAAGGGGASDVRATGSAWSNIVILGGGGGASGRDYCNGSCQPCGCGGASGGGGGTTGVNGGAANNCGYGYPGSGINGGYGGSQSSGGAGGTGDGGGPTGSAGGQTAGGVGASGNYDVAGGGGGGGYYGGGGGGSASSGSGVGGGGGGGGSSYTGGVTSGSSTPATWSGDGQVTITYVSSVPSVPGVITGNASMCANASGNYSIVPIPGATTYTWAVPPGSIINSGQGTTSINLTAGNTSGNISVTATFSCGTSGPSTLMLTIGLVPVIVASSNPASVCSGGTSTLTASGGSTYTWMPGNLTGASVVVAPLITTTYTVTGTNAQGCSNTAMTTVTVIPSPVVTANSTAASVCAGGSVTLTGSGASTYTWDNNVINAVSFVPTATTTYMVTGTDANGCTNTATITVTVNPLPIVTANSSAASVCAGAGVTLTGGGASTYTWNNNVIDAISFVPTATTTYIVTGTDANGCVNTATTTVIVNPLPVVTATSSAASVCTGGSVILTGGGASTYTWNNNVMNAFPFIPTATNTYIVTGTDVNGCVNTATVTVTVNGLLVVALGPNIIQCGGSAILNAGNPGSFYLWNNASTTQTISVSASGTYIVVVTDANGCTGSDTALVTINNAPAVTASASSVIVCVDDAVVTLTGTPTGGVWSGPGVTGFTLSPVAAGVGLQTAIYSYTDANGCEGIASVNVQVNACVGLAENILANGVSVYPNPNNGSFTLGVNANVGALTIKITDMQGRVVYASIDKNVNAGFVKQISLDTQSSGMYLMHIITNGEQQTKKISVQK